MTSPHLGAVVGCLALLWGLAACHEHGHRDDDERGSDHGHGHERHGHEDSPGRCHGEADKEPPQLAFTRWTPHHELFVEIDAPRPGKKIGYFAHITRLQGFEPVTEGRLLVSWLQGGKVVSEVTAPKVARAGLFAPKSAAPPAGEYQLRMRYMGKKVSKFDCGRVTVSAKLPAEEPARASLSFLKEQQWKIPFATAWAGEREVAREIELPAAVEPAGTDQLTIASPTSGRFFHNTKLALAEGTHLKRGDRVGNIAPTVAGDDFNRLRQAVDEARLAKKQAQRERDRVAPLVKEGLLPAKRLVEADNAVERHSASLSAARRRLGRVVAPGGRGGLAIKSNLDGVVTEIFVANGEPVEPGAPLLRVGGEHSRWVRARFVARPEAELEDALPVAVRVPSGERIDVRQRARMLSAHPIVDPRSQLATWIAEVKMGRAGQPASHSLRTGTHVVLLVRVGEPQKRLVVPRSAVVDINTRPYVFVQTGGEEFEKRRVVLGHSDGDYTQVLKGVRKGERVVTRGGYDIHLASIMGQVESHRH